MFRVPWRKYSPGLVDTATGLGRNFISYLRAINGNLEDDNFAPSSIELAKLTNTIGYSHRDFRGYDLDKRNPNERTTNWDNGGEYVIGFRTGAVQRINQILFSTQEQSHAKIIWSGEVGIRNTGRNTFKSASIVVTLDGQMVPGCKFIHSDRIAVVKDPAWPGVDQGIYDLGGNEHRDDREDSDYLFPVTMIASMDVPPGSHVLEAHLNVDFLNPNTGSTSFPDLDDIPNNGVGWYEFRNPYNPTWNGHNYLGSIPRWQTNARTMAVYRRRLAIMGLYR